MSCFDKKRFAFAAGLTASILTFVYYFLVWLMITIGVLVQPDRIALFQGTPLGIASVTLVMVFVSTLIAFVPSFIFGWVFACIYNKLGVVCKKK